MYIKRKYVRVGKMKLIKASAVKESDLNTFIGQQQILYKTDSISEKTSYVIEDESTIISLFQMELVEGQNGWLKKLFITKNDALKLPAVLHTIIQFAKEQNIRTIYVHSKQPVTDLLLSSSSFTLQPLETLRPFQNEKQGNWWFYSI